MAGQRKKDNYEKSTNGIIHDLAEKNTVDNLQQYDLSDSVDAPDICTAPMDPGSCHGHTERWFFDASSESCQSFSYTGCYGNRNNFASQEKCEATCLSSNGPVQDRRSNYWSSQPQQNRYDTTYSQSSYDDSFNQFPALNLYRADPEPPQEDQVEEEIPLRPMTPIGMDAEIDCQVSAWSTWSVCSKSCGTGWQMRHREVLVNPSTYGKSCPKKMTRKRKCSKMPCPADPKYWYQGSWRHMVDPEDE